MLTQRPSKQSHNDYMPIGYYYVSIFSNVSKFTETSAISQNFGHLETIHCVSKNDSTLKRLEIVWIDFDDIWQKY